MKPLRVCGREVVKVRDEWSVIDRWWTDDPIRREYREVELDNRAAVVLVRRPDGAWDVVEELKRPTPQWPPLIPVLRETPTLGDVLASDYQELD